MSILSKTLQKKSNKCLQSASDECKKHPKLYEASQKSIENVDISVHSPDKTMNLSEDDDVVEIKQESNVKPKPIQIDEQKRSTKDDSDEQNETFYSIRISQTEMKKFLNQNRIYPLNGEFYLRNS